jgi:hypothetical protein
MLALYCLHDDDDEPCIAYFDIMSLIDLLLLYYICVCVYAELRYVWD